MNSITDRLNAATAKAENASNIMHRFANDPIGSYIPTDNGLIPSLLEWLAQNQTAVEAIPGLQTAVDQLQNEMTGVQSQMEALFGTNGSKSIKYRDRSVGDRLDDITNVKDRGAIGDGTYHALSERFATLEAAQARYPHVTALNQSIDWAAWQDALNSSASEIEAPDGYYWITDDLLRDNVSVNIRAGMNCTLWFAAQKHFYIYGTCTALPKLSANLVKNSSRAMDFVTAPSPALSNGEIVIAFNPTDYSWSPHRAYYRDGEYFKIHSASDKNAAFYGVPASDYAASAMDMYRLSGMRVVISNLKIIGHASTAGPIMRIRFASNVELHGMDGYGGVSYTVEVDRCFGGEIFSGSLRNNSPYQDDDYGIIISNSHRVNFHGGDHNATRHCIALGGGGGICAVPCRDITINDTTLFNSSGDIGAADMHGNVDRVRYNNCVISHAHIAGRNVGYYNCRIYGRTAIADGTIIYGAEIVGGTYTIQGCVLITTGSLANFAGIHIGANVALLREDLTVMVYDTVFQGPGHIQAVMVRIGAAVGETKNINLDIQGCRCEMPLALCMGFVRCDSDTSQAVVTTGHIVDRIFGPVGMYLMYPTGASVSNAPMRMMRQSGSVPLTTTAATLCSATAQPFRYPYPKVPTFFDASVTGVNGALKDAVGGQVPNAFARQCTTLSLTPAIRSSATFAANDGCTLRWVAEIMDI